MNTKTVEQLREEFEKEYPLIMGYREVQYSEWLEQRLLTPSPERGKEGKTHEEIFNLAKEEWEKSNPKIEGWGEKQSFVVGFIHAYEYAQSTSNPVEPKTRVGEGVIKRAAEILLQAEDKGITSCQQKMRVVFETLNTEGLSLNQESAEREGWISVEERLPTKRGDYLGYGFDGENKRKYYISHFIGSEDGFAKKEYVIPITHWMPLPKFTQTKGEE